MVRRNDVRRWTLFYVILDTDIPVFIIDKLEKEKAGQEPLTLVA